MARRRKKSALILAEMCAFIGLLVLSWAPSYSSMIKAVAAGNEKGDEDTLIEEETKQKLTDSAETFDFEGTGLLEKDKYPEINELIQDYYDTMFSFDLDGMETLVSDISRVDVNLMRAKLEYMERIENIICYTADGPSEGTYRVYVYYDLKIKGIDTLAPALSAFYVTLSSDGNYIIYLNELDADTQEFINKTDASEDVKMLSELVSKRFEDVVANDENMKNFYEMMEQSTSGQSTSSDAAATEAPATE